MKYNYQIFPHLPNDPALEVFSKAVFSSYHEVVEMLCTAGYLVTSAETPNKLTITCYAVTPDNVMAYQLPNIYLFY